MNVICLIFTERYLKESETILPYFNDVCKNMIRMV